MKLMLWPWWMYCGYFFWWGEGKQRNTVSDMSTSVSRKAIKTSTWPQHYMIPHVSTRSRYFSTSDAKNNKRNLKFSCTKIQSDHNASQTVFFSIPANRFTTPVPDVYINPDCAQWITPGIFFADSFLASWY